MRSLNLLVLRCRDVDLASSFYELLGLRFERHQHGNGPEHLAHEDGEDVLELYPANADAATDQTGLGFDTPDLTAARQAFAERGFAPAEVRETPWGRTFVVRDPDGRRVEVRAAGSVENGS